MNTPMTFIKTSNGSWWELDKNNMTVFNFNGGFHDVTQKHIDESEIITCDSWHELYNLKHWCPLEVTIKYHDVWISPDGKFYNGDAHENRAEEILEIIYGECDVDWAGDRLEELGWIRATTTLMWEVRIDDYWTNKKLKQKQYDALWDWCQCHNKRFPQAATTN